MAVARTVPGKIGSTANALIYAAGLAETKTALSAAAGNLYFIKIDNTANTSAVHLKLYDAAVGDVTVGTTDPYLVWMCPASTELIAPIAPGVAFATALTGACVAEGGTGGTTAPTQDVNVTLYYSA